MTSTIFNPLFLISIVFGLYIFIKNQVWRKRLKYIGILLSLFFTNVWISNVVTHLWEYETIKPREVIEPYDIGIILGPFINVGLNIPVRSESIRFTQAVQLYKQKKFNKFLLSGNDSSEQTRKHLLELCVPPEDILVEDKSEDTYENAQLSSHYLNQLGFSSKKLLLVTSALHMRRAKKCFDKAGLDVTPMSVDYKTSCTETWTVSLSDIIPNYRALVKWEGLIREFGSTVYFRLRNYI